METFVVRIELNQEHVSYLKSLAESGIELAPLRLSDGDNELIDGRHRLAAYRAMNQTVVFGEFKTYDSSADKIIDALRSNVGGSLPPTSADISHVMQMLLTAGESRKSIIEKISTQVGFPARLVKNHLDYVQSNLHKSRLKKAMSAVVNQGKTVPEAAAEHGVKLETLQANLKVKGDGEKTVSVNQLKSHLSVNFNKLNSVFGQNLSRLVRDLSDGVTSQEEVLEVIGHVAKLVKRLNHRHEEWIKRFDIHMDSKSTAVEVSRKKARVPSEKMGKRALIRMGL